MVSVVKSERGLEEGDRVLGLWTDEGCLEGRDGGFELKSKAS